MTSNTIKEMKKIERSIRHVAESLRGVDMGAYTHLITAADLITQATISVKVFIKRKRPAPTPINTLLNNQA